MTTNTGMVLLYRVKDWDKIFENNRTRELKHLDWVPMPNKMDGDGYTELLDHPDGMSHFAAWVLIVEVASKCDKEKRGTLVRDRDVPHDARSLARVTRGSAKIFEAAIPRLVAIGWLEQIEVNVADQPVTSSCLNGDANPAGACDVTAGSCEQVPTRAQARSVPFSTVPFSSRDGVKGEGKLTKEQLVDEVAKLEIPASIDSDVFRAKWAGWVYIRIHNHKLPKGSVKDYFRGQLEWLAEFPKETALRIVSDSQRNRWQGLFEPKEYGAANNQRGTGGSGGARVNQRNGAISGAERIREDAKRADESGDAGPWVAGQEP